jgi:hypothetical protein
VTEVAWRSWLTSCVELKRTRCGELKLPSDRIGAVERGKQ